MSLNIDLLVQRVRQERDILEELGSDDLLDVAYALLDLVDMFDPQS